LAEPFSRSDEDIRRAGAPAMGPTVADRSDLDRADPHPADTGCKRHLVRRPPRRRTGIRRACLALMAFAASLLFIAAVAATLVFVRLRQGPITLDLKSQIVAALNSRVGHGYGFDLAGTSIEATDHGPALTIDRLSISDASARLVVSAPRAAIAVDPMALLVGRIAPRRLDIHDVDLHLVILPDGQVAVSAGSNEAAFPLSNAFLAPAGGSGESAAIPVSRPDATGSTPPRPANAALRAMSAALRSLVDATTASDSALNALERVSVTGRLVLDDRTHGTKTVFNNTVLSFDRASDGAATLSVAADGPTGRWSLRAHAAVGAGDSKELTVDAQDLSLDEITLAGGLHSLGFDFDTPVSAHLAIRLGSDGELDTLKGTFAFGQGYFRLDDPDHEPLLIDSVSGGLHLDRSTNGIDIDRTELRAGGSDFVMTGHVDVPHAADDPWAMRIEASGTFGAERPGEKPVRIARASAGLRLYPSGHRLLIDRAEVTGPEVDFSDTGEIRQVDAGIRLRNTASVKHMPAEVLARLWPSLIAAPVRAWLLANLRGGIVESGRATVDLNGADLALMRAERSVADDHVRVDFKVSNLSLAFMPGVPTLDGIDAQGVVTGRTFNMDVARGTMDVSAGRRLTLADGNFHVADNDPKPTPATIEAHVQGGVDTVADLLARDALKRYAGPPLDLAAVRGQIDGHLSIRLKLGKDVPPDEVKVGVTATATNFGFDKLIGKEGLSDATIKLDVDPSGMHAKGEGRIYGSSATIDVRKAPNGVGEAVLSMALDDAARAKAGLNAGGVKGIVAARITAALVPGDKTRAAVDLDFARAAIDGVVPGFSKPLGRPGKATLTVLQRDNGTTLDNIAFEGGGATVRGTAELDRDGDFVAARLSQVKLSPGDDLRVEAQQSGDVLKVTARGANLDARPFLKWLTAPTPAGGGSANADTGAKGALDLDLRSTVLSGQNSQAVTGADVHLTRRGGQLKRLTIAGHIGRQPLTVTTTQNDAAPHFLIRSGDAGATLLFMDLYKRMVRGQLDANLVMAGQRLDGHATVHDFTIREDPAIHKLAVEGLASQKHEAADGGEASPPSVDTSAMSFGKLDASFSKTGNIVEVRDGSMVGPALGATVAGTIDFSRDQVSLAGTFVPLFGVNNLFSQVPLFGPLLGGGRQEGLFGLSYRITGSAGNPVLNVNPLSVLAPGFLREVFGALDASARGASPPRDRADGPRPRAGEE
jgi:hypothetical protein